MWATNSNNQMILSCMKCGVMVTVTARKLASDSKVPHSSQDDACGLVGLSLRTAHLLYSWQLCVGTSDKTYVK